MMKKSLILCSAILVAALISLSSAFAGDWPQWGNTPDRNMVAPDKNLPSDWSPGTRDAKGDWD